jgi:trk system potassium uptake protein TrkH
VRHPLHSLGSIIRRRGRSPTPAQVIVLSFFLAVIVGTFILSLPVAHTRDHQVSVAEALFTATSAVCVTGLIVLDIATEWSRFGQTVVMLLIKVGGLGILTLGALLALATGRRLGYEERLRLQMQTNALNTGGIVRLVRNIVLFTVVAELAGVLVLYPRFAGIHGPLEGLFYALFHSISAFNNAGFALYEDGLMRYVEDPLVSLTLAALFIIGGLGFTVGLDLLTRYRQKMPLLLSLHTKMVLLMTGLLLLLGTLVFAVLEWTNPATLGPLSLSGKLLASFFQAATPRTAGFNSLDYGVMSTPTIVFTMLLMFIGGSPGSTAGGIKTVTFLVLIGSTWMLSRGRGQLVLFHRRIDANTVIKASVIATMGVMLVGAAFTVLAITDPAVAPLPLLFETVSAFSTVGLSMGVTGELGEAGRSVIIGLMFLGRVGLLTFALALVEKQPERNLQYPAEDIVMD